MTPDLERKIRDLTQKHDLLVSHVQGLTAVVAALVQESGIDEARVLEVFRQFRVPHARIESAPLNLDGYASHIVTEARRLKKG